MKENSKRNEHTILVCYIPKALKHKFKVYCAEERVSMSTAIRRAISEMLRSREKEG